MYNSSYNLKFERDRFFILKKPSINRSFWLRNGLKLILIANIKNIMKQNSKIISLLTFESKILEKKADEEY
jgi:hypothetical protein